MFNFFKIYLRKLFPLKAKKVSDKFNKIVILLHWEIVFKRHHFLHFPLKKLLNPQKNFTDTHDKCNEKQNTNLES